MTKIDTDFLNIWDLLNEDEKMICSLTRDFMAAEVTPLIVDAFHQEKPMDMHQLAPKFGARGLIGSFLPEEYGTAGTNYVGFGLICQEAARVDDVVRGYIAEMSGLVMYPIWKYGSEEHKNTWLPLLASGKAVGCFGLTEPNQGSDVSALETRATRSGNKWVINGTKQWISEAANADFAVVFAQSDDGVRGFLVESGNEGFTQHFESKRGSMRAGDVGELIFDNCEVSVENALPQAIGLKAPLSCLNQARYAIAWGSLGVAIDCYETALKYALERRQFGSPIAAFQLVQDKLVTMLIQITQAQLIAYRVGRLMDDGRAKPAQLSMAKKNNTQVARDCSRISRDLLGANGTSLEYSPIRHMANTESVYTYQGTDNIHTLIIGQDITGISAFRRESRSTE